MNSNLSSQYVRSFRLSCGLTIKDLAQRIRGNYRFISNVENSRSLPSVSLLLALSKCFPSFNLSLALAQLIRDKSVMDSATLLKRLHRRSAELDEESYSDTRLHLAMTPLGLMGCAFRSSDLIAFAGFGCDIVLPNPCPAYLDCKTIMVRTLEPTEGQLALIVNVRRPVIAKYSPEFHGAHPAFQIVGILKESCAYYCDKALPKNRKRKLRKGQPKD